MVVLDQVKQAAGGGHEHVAAALELGDLPVELGAADHDGGALAGLGAHDARDLVDLMRQLARGGDHQGKGSAAPLCRAERAVLARDALQRW